MKKRQLSFRNVDFTHGCRALKAWGRGGLFKTHVSSGVSSGENEALGGGGGGRSNSRLWENVRSGVGSWQPPRCWMPSL